MKSTATGVAALLFALSVPAFGATALPETHIAYSIEVLLDPETRMLDGEQTIRWRNPSSGLGPASFGLPTLEKGPGTTSLQICYPASGSIPV